MAAFGVRCCEHGCQHAGFSEVSPGETNHVSSLHFCDKHAAAYHPPPPRKKTSVLGHFRPTARNSPKDDVTRGGGCSTTTPGAARPPSHSALHSTADSGTCAGGGGATSSTASNFTRMEYMPLPVHAAVGMLTGGDSAVTMGDKGTCAGGGNGSFEGAHQHRGRPRTRRGRGAREERATAAMSIQAIYSRHPEWQRGARRLTGSLDHMNPRAWLL